MPQEGWTSEELYLLADRAYGFYRQGHYNEAAVMFEGLIALDASNAYYRSALAAICLELGHTERAIEELTVVLENSPADHEARARRCEAYCEMERWSDARYDLSILQRNGEHNHARRLSWRIQAGSVSAA
jgi:predicted Zn-dependent protease